MMFTKRCPDCGKEIGKAASEEFRFLFCECEEHRFKTVLCHGCFDVIHFGHLKHLEKAKAYGDRLVVSITTDRFVRKGPGRPFFDSEKRAAMLRALGIIDEVFICDDPTALPAISKYKPDFYVKGSDYSDASKDVTGEIANEKKAVESYGGKLVFTNEETYSSSSIINKVFRSWTSEQQSAIERVASFGGIEAIKEAIENINRLRVLIVGEPIVDVYRFVRPEGISSKSPSISTRLQCEEEYRGGSWAIENHLASFAHKTNLVCHSRAARKIRYIAGTQRIFEVTDINEDIANREFIADKILEISKNSDLVILADFGHGMFEGEVLDACKQIKSHFTSLNVQTNSSNYGFNLYTKHDKFDYLCLDTREARLARSDRLSHPITVAHAIKESIKRPFGFTAGENGAYLMYGAQTYFSPTFSDVVVDATGAGDAYFAITSCLLATECNPNLIPFIGNVFAGLKCKIIGNKGSVSKASLLKACEAILK